MRTIGKPSREQMSSPVILGAKSSCAEEDKEVKFKHKID